MNATTTARITLLALTVSLFGLPAAAQTPVQTFVALQPLLKPGQSIIVTDAKGISTHGRVVSIAGSEVVVGGGKRQSTFAEDRVRRIDKDDGSWNGMLIGTGIGTLLAVAMVNHPSAGSEGEEAALGVLAILGGMWLGEHIDDAIHRSLFIAPGHTSLSIRPIVGRARAGFASTIHF